MKEETRVFEPATVIIFVTLRLCVVGGEAVVILWSYSGRRVPVPDDGRGHYRGGERGFLLSSVVTAPQPVSTPSL